MRVAVPRYGSGEHLVIRAGDINDWFGWIIHEELFPSEDSDEWSPTGSCLHCSGQGWWCEVSYSGYRGTEDKDTWHVGVVWQEGQPGSPLGGSETFDVQVRARDGDYRYHTGDNDWTCAPCVEGGEYGPHIVNPVPEIMGYMGDIIQWVKPLARYDGTSKKWFRDLWNSLVPVGYQVQPDQPAPIEPSADRFVLYYGTIGTIDSPVSHSGSGWCKISGAFTGEDCVAAANGDPCSYSPPALGHVSLGYWRDISGPSLQYPFYIKRNGGTFAKYPGSAEISYYDADTM